MSSWRDETGLCDRNSRCGNLHGVPGDGSHLERQNGRADRIRLEDIVVQIEIVHDALILTQMKGRGKDCM